MSKFKEIPDRRYAGGDKKMYSMRLPERLIAEIEALAEAKGWTTTDLVVTVMDQYIQWEKKQKPRS